MKKRKADNAKEKRKDSETDTQRFATCNTPRVGQFTFGMVTTMNICDNAVVDNRFSHCVSHLLSTSSNRRFTTFTTSYRSSDVFLIIHVARLIIYEFPASIWLRGNFEEKREI